MVNGSKFHFLQANMSFPHVQTNSMQRIAVFENPALFGIFNCENTDLLINCIFECVSHNFYQCIIVMAFYKQTQLCVPILYILITRKIKELYWNALCWEIVVSKWRLIPRNVTSYFKLGSLHVIKGQLLDVIENGCLFQLKKS